MIWDILKLIFYLLIFAVVIWATYYSCKKLAAHGSNFGGSKYMQIIDRMMLGKDVAITMLQIGNQYLLVSQTVSGVELIREFTEEEFEEIQQNEISSNRVDNPIANIFGNILGGGLFAQKNKTENGENKGFDFSRFLKPKKDDGEILGRYDGDINDVENIDFNEILKKGLSKTDSEERNGKLRRTAKDNENSTDTTAVDEILKSVNKRKKNFVLRKEEKNATETGEEQK